MAEVKNNKFKIVLRKILRFFIRLFKKIGLFFKKSHSSFMKLKPYIRYIIYVWSLILLLFLIFIIVSSSNNKFLKKYQDYEKSFETASLNYVKENNRYPTKEKPIKISMDMLKSYGYLESNAIKDKSCVGYSSIYYDDEHADYKVRPYINCDKYTTEGYIK